MAIPVICIEKLQKSFGQRVILDDINLQVNAQESMVIIGGSGTGKSVLIKCILGLLPIDKGQIYLNGKNVTKLSSRERYKILAEVGMLFQGGALFDSMTVVENVAFGLIQGKGMPPVEARKIAIKKITEVELTAAVASVYPAELSGGMQKRVALARAIATNPKIIFFDEPTTGLDPIVSSAINDLIVRCVKNIGASTITITHDMKSLKRIADRVGLLFKGKLIWNGTLDEMDSTTDPHVHQFVNGLPNGPFSES